VELAGGFSDECAELGEDGLVPLVVLVVDLALHRAVVDLDRAEAPLRVRVVERLARALHVNQQLLPLRTAQHNRGKARRMSTSASQANGAAENKMWSQSKM
jgi:hypothetical protein